jgi:hypothetical protein
MLSPFNTPLTRLLCARFRVLVKLVTIRAERGRRPVAIDGAPERNPSGARANYGANVHRLDASEGECRYTDAVDRAREALDPDGRRLARNLEERAQEGKVRPSVPRTLEGVSVVARMPDEQGFLGQSADGIDAGVPLREMNPIRLDEHGEIDAPVDQQGALMPPRHLS